MISIRPAAALRLLGIAAVTLFAVLAGMAGAARADTTYAPSAFTVSPQGAGYHILDLQASNGTTVVLYSNGMASGQFSLPNGLSRIVVNARGTQCASGNPDTGGAPEMGVTVDGSRVLTKYVTTTTYADYSVDVSIPSGSHIISVAFLNDYADLPTCDRNLYVDSVQLQDSSPAAATPSNLYFGATLDTHYGTSGVPPWDMSAQTDFNDLSGKGASIGSFGLRLATDTFSASIGDAFRNNGIIPMLTLATRINNTDTLKMVADGDFDSLLRDHFAVPIAQWGHPMFIRLNWEFNGNWYPWAVGVNGNTAADYVAAWRHVVDLFRANGATNVSWVWCANAWASGYGLSTLAQAYPGDAYVDWTALDGYRHVGSGLTFSQIFGRYYDYITTTLAPTKPIMVAETATVEQITGGLSKAQWIADMFNAIPTRFPKLAALLYFDENYGSEGNYSLDSSPAASQAWRDGIAASAFQANDFTTLNTSPIPPPSP